MGPGIGESSQLINIRDKIKRMALFIKVTVWAKLLKLYINIKSFS